MTKREATKALHQAVKENRAAEIPALIAQGANIHARASNGRTILHKAAELSTTEVVRALLDAGADPWALDAVKVTPLFRAPAANQKMLLEAVAPERRTEYIDLIQIHVTTALHVAATWGDIDSVQVLLDYGASIDLKDALNVTGYEPRTAEDRARENGHEDIVNLIRATRAARDRAILQSIADTLPPARPTRARHM